MPQHQRAVIFSLRLMTKHMGMVHLGMDEMRRVQVKWANAWKR